MVKSSFINRAVNNCLLCGNQLLNLTSKKVVCTHCGGKLFVRDVWYPVRLQANNYPIIQFGMKKILGELGILYWDAEFQVKLIDKNKRELLLSLRSRSEE
jgi:DNA-directed RNA polymerase subunit RPC12/RpoP